MADVQFDKTYDVLGTHFNITTDDTELARIFDGDEIDCGRAERDCRCASPVVLQLPVSSERINA